MPVTLTHIARKAGVSPATVSLALRGDRRVAEATRERVCGIAEKAGYVPNNVGRALRSKRSRLIGYLLPDVTASFYSEVLQVPLATFRYESAPEDTRPQLGFIIEDIAPSLAVYDGLDKVDLYGYTSMAVAAVQVQAREIDALTSELDAMRERMKALDERLKKLEQTR